MADELSAWFGSTSFQPVAPIQLSGFKVLFFDFSVGSDQLGEAANYEELSAFIEHIDQLLVAEQADFGFGGYGEVRPFYNTIDFSETTECGLRWRTVHLGVDVWGAAGTPVFAPLDATVERAFIDSTTGGYGPAVILRHDSPVGVFFTLYGHLSHGSIERLRALTRVQRGDQIATLGAQGVNGGWPPHLHFQVITDLLGKGNDFPGVAFADEAEAMLKICPSPYPFFVEVPRAKL